MKYLFFAVAILLASCSSEIHEPDFYYKAKFDVGLVDQVDTYFKELANTKSIEIFEKDRREMKAISQGKDAFYISYYVSDKETPVLWVTNAGSGNVLDLGLLSNEGYPLSETEKLAALVVSDLKKMFGINMVAVENTEG